LWFIIPYLYTSRAAEQIIYLFQNAEEKNIMGAAAQKKYARGIVFGRCPAAFEDNRKTSWPSENFNQKVFKRTGEVWKERRLARAAAACANLPTHGGSRRLFAMIDEQEN